MMLSVVSLIAVEDPAARLSPEQVLRVQRLISHRAASLDYDVRPGPPIEVLVRDVGVDQFPTGLIDDIGRAAGVVLRMDLSSA
jgi:hypothetical protein